MQYDMDALSRLQAELSALSRRVQHLEAELALCRLNHPPAPPASRDLPSVEHGRPVGRDTVAAHLQRLTPDAEQPHPPMPLERVAVPMAATRVVVTQLVSPADSNGRSVCTGGSLLSWIDVAAGLAAKSLARGPCVTASVDAVHFLSTCSVGSVVVVAAMVNRTFRSSMEVGVRVEDEDPRTGARRHCCSAYLTFVAVQPGGGTMRPLPAVCPTSSRYEEIHADAARRRQARLAARERLRSDPGAAAAEADCRLHPVTHRERTPTLPPALRWQEAEGAVARVRVAPGLTTAHVTHIIMPQHANSIGITFGGQVMRWMEQAAFIVASRVCRGCDHVLTASMDSVSFKRPTHVGDSMYVEAQATAVFGSSVEVQISVWGEAPELGLPFHCGDAYATIVSVSVGGDPLDIPFEIVPGTRVEAARRRGAEDRRAARLRLREQLRREKGARPSLDDEAYAAGLPERGAAEV